MIYGSMSGNVAVVVPVFDVTVSVTSVNVTLTSTGTIRSGHGCACTELVLTLNVPRPDRVLKGCEPETDVDVV
jgi:hypothetical protein